MIPNLRAFARRGALPIVVARVGEAPNGYFDIVRFLEGASSSGADMVGVGVRSTADGHLVVRHDPAILGHKVRDLSLQEAESLGVETGRPIQRFDDLLECARGAVGIGVELKEAGFEDDVLAALRQSGYGVDDFLVTSFDAGALRAVRAAWSDVATGLLLTDVTPDVALLSLTESSASFLAPNHVTVNDRVLRIAEEAGVFLVPWTVNDTSSLERLMRSSVVAGVITDRPELATDVLRHLERSDGRTNSSR